MTTATTHKPDIGDLLQAIHRDDLEAVRGLLDQGVNANVKNEQNSSVLLLALKNSKKSRFARGASAEHVAIMRLLINRGADVNAVNNRGQTPLHWAATYGYTDTVRLLLEKDADINAIDSDGETPLIKATYTRNAETAALLLENGARRDIVDQTGKTAEDWAASAHNAPLTDVFNRFVRDVVAEKQDLLRSQAPRLRIKRTPSP
jgi:ankyrin repeat protein